MKLGTATQQPTERLSYTITYDEALTVADGDIITSATYTVTPADLTILSVIVNHPTVKFWVTGGISGTSYKVQFTVETDEGRAFQDEITFKIKEI